MSSISGPAPIGLVNTCLHIGLGKPILGVALGGILAFCGVSYQVSQITKNDCLAQVVALQGGSGSFESKSGMVDFKVTNAPAPSEVCVTPLSTTQLAAYDADLELSVADYEKWLAKNNI